MDWTEIVVALALVMFIVVMFPTAKHMVQTSPKGSSSDWGSFALLIGMIVLFIILLIGLV